MKKKPSAHIAKRPVRGRARSSQVPPKRTASSLPEALALLIVLLTAASAVFIFQGSPDLWDLWHARARYGVRWSGVGCPQ